MTASQTSPRTAPRTALIGSGAWGSNLARNLAKLQALAAVCDSDRDRALQIAESHGVRAMPLEEILSPTGPEAVVVAAPAATHGDLVRRALCAGKHVMVEKPLALDVEEARELCVLAEKSGLVLMVGHLLQYHNAFLKLKDLVRAGELGRLQYMYSNRLNLGKIRREENILWSFAPHDISMILSLAGEEPEQVRAEGSWHLHDDIADVTTTHLRFQSGISAQIFVSWLHPFKEQKLIVVGEKAMAVFDDLEPWSSKLKLYDHRIDWKDGHPLPNKAQARLVALEEAEPLTLECQHFLDCVAARSKPRTDGAEGLRVLKVLDAAEKDMVAARRKPREELKRSDGQALTLRMPDAKPVPGDAFVHPSSYVDAGVEIGVGTRIWHFSHVLSGSRIGKGCNIGQNVVIGPRAVVGDGCKIQNNVSVYEGVELGNDVFCGPSMVFTNVVNPRANIERKSEYRPTRVGDGATIGANATIVCGHQLGHHCFIAAGAVVACDVPPFALMAGVPARRIGWVGHAGTRLGPDGRCPETGRLYRETEPERLVEIDHD